MATLAVENPGGAVMPQSLVIGLAGYIADQFPDPEVMVFDRALRPMDSNGSIGVYGVDMVPMMDSMEMGGPFSAPILNRYSFKIQNMGKGDQATAGRRYSQDAKAIVRMLANNGALPLRLQELTEQTELVHERVQRFGYTRQRYLNNEFRGTFIYLAVTEFWIETESVPV